MSGSVQSTDWLPPHAYIPGATARHPEGLFDPLKDLGQGALEQCPAWGTGLRFYTCRFYWEAHEVLEAVWLAAPPNAPERSVVQGVIQLANAGLKYRMAKRRAAERLTLIARRLLDDGLRDGPRMGLGEKDVAGLWLLLDRESGLNCAI